MQPSYLALWQSRPLHAVLPYQLFACMRICNRGGLHSTCVVPTATGRAHSASQISVCGQIEAARQRGPEAFKQCVQEALQYAKTISPDAPQGWHWVECDACTKWRLVSGACCGLDSTAGGEGREGMASAVVRLPACITVTNGPVCPPCCVQVHAVMCNCKITGSCSELQCAAVPQVHIEALQGRPA